MQLVSLQKAPWLGLSLLVHVVATVLIILWIREPVSVAPGLHVTVQPEGEPDLVLEASKPDPIALPELPEDDILIENFVEKRPEVDPPDVIICGPQLKEWPVPTYRRRRVIICRRSPRRRPFVIDNGLQWLAKHQDEDGKWDADGFMKHDSWGPRCDGPGKAIHDVGVTGLALLAFLGDGHTARTGLYKDNVKRAVRWLRYQQQPNGLFGTNAPKDFIYNHAVAALAMCEAYGLSRYTVLRKPAQLGVNYLESHRNPNGVWRYQPQNNDHDTSVTSWALMVYKSAKDFRLLVNDRAFDLTRQYLDEVTDPANGRCGYTRRGEPSSRHAGDHRTWFPPRKGETLTAMGLMARFYLGQDPKKHKVMALAADSILEKPPTWKCDGSIDHCYWFYATYALYHLGGAHWKEWSTRLHDAVVKTQRRDGNFRGSWDPAGVWGEDGGRVYSTAMLTITLEAYYRYTRLVR